MMLNFNQERLKLADALKQLNDQITNLSEDLERYKATPKASEKFVFFKSQQIKILESILESFNEYSDNTNQLFTDNQKEIAKLKTENFKLFGICILHGISNINSYAQMKKNAVVDLVKRAFAEGWRQTPFELTPTITPQDKKETSIILRQAQSYGKNKK